MRTYLENNYNYPIINPPPDQAVAEATKLLKDDFTRAVIIQVPDLEFNERYITDLDSFDTSRFWTDPKTRKEGQLSPGENTFFKDTLTPEAIQKEANECGVQITDKGLSDLQKKMLLAADIFSKVTAQYNETDNFKMRLWQMWAQKETLGRTPNFHTDRTYLTGLWYAARAPLEIYTGDVPQDAWEALSPQYQGDHQDSDLVRKFSNSAAPQDIIHAPIHSLIIAKNAKGKDLRTPKDQQSICIHRSGDIPTYGQAGIVMAPKLL